jgi:hypothetical protein
MASCCKKTNNTTHQANFTAKKLINTLKSSIFCGTKGFLTFSLASLSYLEYSLHSYEKQGKSNSAYEELKKGAVFAIKRNSIPFMEMLTIIPFICFALPAMIPSINLLQCVLICAALMITTCFIVRTFNLREKLLENTTNYTRGEIDKEFTKDPITYPIFNQDRKHIQYNAPSPGKLLKEANNDSFLVMFLVFPLKVLQSFILLALAVVELLEAVPNLFVDMIYDRSFDTTKSNLQRSGHLLYASVRNLIPMSKFDEPVAEFIGAPKAACCGA